MDRGDNMRDWEINVGCQWQYKRLGD